MSDDLSVLVRPPVGEAPPEASITYSVSAVIVESGENVGPLFPIAGKPILLHQLGLLARSGFRAVTIVSGPARAEAASSLVRRAFRLPDFDVTCSIVRPGQESLGTVADIAARNNGNATLIVPSNVIVPTLPAGTSDWIVTPKDVPFCMFTDGAMLAQIIQHHVRQHPLPSRDRQADWEEIITAYGLRRPLRTVIVSGLRYLHRQDTTSKFNCRAGNELRLLKTGVVNKRGLGSAFKSEAAFYRDLDTRRAFMMPRVVSVAHDLSSYQIEHVNQRTLAEQWLFGTLDDGSLVRIFRNLIGKMQEYFWRGGATAYMERHILTRYTRQMYVEKTFQRFSQWAASAPHLALPERVNINGDWMAAGWPVVWALCQKLDRIAVSPIFGHIHGDLHFSNIFYSPTTQWFKLIDPRGEFGVPAPSGDVRYDAAKLRHSYNGRYDLIIHDLFEVRELGKYHWRIRFAAHPPRPVKRLDALLQREGFSLLDIQAIEASLFLSMIPLHADSPSRQLAIYIQGLLLAQGSVRERAATC